MDAGTGGNPDLTAVNGNAYGSYVDINELAHVLGETRVLRLALNVLWDNLPGNAPGEAFTKIHESLTKAETRALREHGFAEHYVVIRPFSPVRLPDAEAMEEITSAIRTLRRHGMLVQASDAMDRDDEC